MASLSIDGFVRFLGRRVINGWRYIIDIIIIIYVSLKAFVTLGKGRKRVINEILYKKLDRSIVNTSGIIGVIAFIFGAMVVTQISLMGLRMDVLGTIFDMVIIKELGPLLTMLIVTGRSATFITTEIATMKVTQELTAFTVMGIDPKHYVMMPRVIGVTIALVILIIFFDLCCCIGGLTMTFLLHNISTTFYIQSIISQVSFVEVYGTIIKGLISGLLLTSISCYHGLAVKGSFVEMPSEVAKSFVSSLFFCFFANFLISYLLYL